MSTEHDSPLRWDVFMQDLRQRVSRGVALESRGTLTRLTGLVLEATGIRVPVGSHGAGSPRKIRSRCWLRWWASRASVPF